MRRLASGENALTLEIVQSRLDRLLAGQTPKVAMLTGDWGAGKTYQWKQALERAAGKGNHPRYAYVSLFGLTSRGTMSVSSKI